MDAKKALEQERNELNTLIGKGLSFEIEDTQFDEERKFFGLIKKRTPVKAVRHFKIEEPTLGTLDRLSAEWIEFDIDEQALQSEDGIKRARTMVNRHANRCAKVIALAVLGTDYLIPKHGKGGIVRYIEDTKELEHLTALFARTIQPSKLYQLYVMINAMCNLGDFTNSIRLMSTDRTTMPILIENNKV